MLDGLRHRLLPSEEELHARDLRARFARPGEDDGDGVTTTAVADAPERGPVRLRGEVSALQVVPRAGAPSLEVTLDDGTGRVVAVFSGRRRIGGLDPGRAVEVEGVARRERGRLVLSNPAYTLLP